MKVYSAKFQEKYFLNFPFFCPHETFFPKSILKDPRKVVQFFMIKNGLQFGEWKSCLINLAKMVCDCEECK